MARPSWWPEDETDDDAPDSSLPWLESVFDPIPPKQWIVIGGDWIEFDMPTGPVIQQMIIGGRTIYF